MMAVRAVNTCCVLRSSSPSLSPFRCHLHKFRSLHLRKSSKLGFRSSTLRSELHANGYGCVRVCSFTGFVDSVLEELQVIRRLRRVRATSKLELQSSGELLEDKLEKHGLRGGLLLEFKKDSERVLLAVAQKPDGKKNWMVSDQNGVTSSIRPQQITYIVPGVENFDQTQISEFVHKAQHNLDPTLLELAWAELIENDKSVTAEELAEMIYGIAEPIESYCAHLLLSKDEIYFSVLENKSYHSVYAPRPSDQDTVESST